MVGAGRETTLAACRHPATASTSSAVLAWASTTSGKRRTRRSHRLGPRCHRLERVGRGKAQLALSEANQGEGDFVDAVDRPPGRPRPHRGTR